METQKIDRERLKLKMSVEELDRKYHDLYEASLVVSDAIKAIDVLNDGGSLNEYEYAKLVSPILDVQKMISIELGETHEATETAMKKAKETPAEPVKKDNTVDVGEPMKIVEYLNTDYCVLDNNHKAVKFYYEKLITPHEEVSVRQASNKYNADFAKVSEIINEVERREKDEDDYYRDLANEESDYNYEDWERHVEQQETDAIRWYGGEL